MKFIIITIILALSVSCGKEDPLGRGPNIPPKDKCSETVDSRGGYILEGQYARCKSYNYSNQIYCWWK